MTKRELETLVGLERNCSYHEANKREFRRLSMKLLRETRKLLGIEADVRFNPGGIAVSGDAILHGDTIYISYNADGICGLGILYRTCKGRKDYTGGKNNYFRFACLLDNGAKGLAQALHDLWERQAAAANDAVVQKLASALGWAKEDSQ